jgi:hypothetical protein
MKQLVLAALGLVVVGHEFLSTSPSETEVAFRGALDAPDARVCDLGYRWNAKTRAAAIEKIRQDLATSGR